MNPWSSLAVLVSLAAAAGKLPSSLAPLVPEGPPVRRVDLAAGPAVNEVDPEARRILEDVKPRVEVLVNPIMGKILDRSGGTLPDVEAWKARGTGAMRAASARWGRTASCATAALVAAAVGGAFLFLLLGMKGVSRPLAERGLDLCRAWVLLASVGGAVLFAGAGVSLWKLLPSPLWTVPMAGMLLNAGVLRCVDMNHPVWNRLVSGFLVPIACWTFMYFWARALGRPFF